MTENTPQSQPNTAQNDKELNFRALEQKYQKQLQEERAARLEAERMMNETRQKFMTTQDDDDDSEPYVDKKRLKKEQARFGEQIKQETQSEIQKAVNQALYQERNQSWMKQNPDHEEVMRHANKLMEVDKELAETILDMPENFERYKLGYKTVKSLGLHKEKSREPSIQEKVEANRRSPFYQPSGVGTAPYNSQGDFSVSGQKNAYDKMKELQARLRI